MQAFFITKVNEYYCYNVLKFNSPMKTNICNIILFCLVLPIVLPAQGTWTQKADYLGTRRFDFIGYALSNKGYIGTGTYGGINSFLGDWQEFDPVLNTWTQKAPLPMRFTGGTGFAAGNYGYAACGANDATYIFDTYEFNPIGNNWSTKVAFDMTRLKATGIGAGNLGYIIGGYDVMATAMNDCWEYNQPANTWTQKASLPVMAARYYATGFAVNGKIYVLGGTDGNNLLNDLWEFNPTNNSWAQKASLPGEARQQAMAFVINNIAYVVGGFPSSPGTLKDFWKYDAITDQWAQLPDFPGATGPAGGVAFTISGSGYVVCGNGTAECWAFTPQITGISEKAIATDVTVYPNPSSLAISVRLPAGTVAESVSIFNISGKMIEKGMSAGTSDGGIDIRNLRPGYYLVKVKTGNGTLLNGNFIKSAN
jgi:N-acetylneuraminic acid mutarotase